MTIAEYKVQSSPDKWYLIRKILILKLNTLGQRARVLHLF